VERVVLASGNAAKLRELGAILEPARLRLVPQGELGVDAAEETGLSFHENALIKARHAARATGLPALADDSGLAVDALGGRPGIRSARYAGAGASDRQNLDKLLAEIEGFGDAALGARFICVIALLRRWDDPVPLLCEGLWRGRLLHQPRGQGGFGYDPIFYVPAAGCTAAELEADHKNRISHRGRALAALTARLAGEGAADDA